MRNIIVFNMVTLDGYFEGPDQDINWHTVDEEFDVFARQQLDEVDALLFGRVTYELMAGYWPTPAAMADDPVIAEKMNKLPKIVVSKTLGKAEWNNTRLVRENLAEEISQLKRQPGKDLIMFGSSELAVSLIQKGLIDEIRIMVSPVVLGRGKPIFSGIDETLALKLIRTKTFRNGNVLLCYETDKASETPA